MDPRLRGDDGKRRKGPMTFRLSTTDSDFAAAFAALVDARREADEDVSRDVAAILKRVRAEGDAALADYNSRFDRHDLDVSGWAVGPAQCRKALASRSEERRAGKGGVGKC